MWGAPIETISMKIDVDAADTGLRFRRLGRSADRAVRTGPCGPPIGSHSPRRPARRQGVHGRSVGLGVAGDPAQWRRPWQPTDRTVSPAHAVVARRSAHEPGAPMNWDNDDEP
jgi:hypothetical protein